MADIPAFQLHHVIEQQAIKSSKILETLSKIKDPATGRYLFEIEASQNLLNLPASTDLATKLNVTPHTGGPLGAYSSELKRQLGYLEESTDFAKAQAGDLNAGRRLAAQVSQ